MATKAHKKMPEVGILGRNVARNLYRYRKQVYPPLSVKRLAVLAGMPGSDSGIEAIERAQDPSIDPPNPTLKTIEKLAYGLQQAGVDVSAADLFATPSKPTGRRDHLRVVPATGDALPAPR
jgi:hypothetical protein